uniref:Transposase n=1 Tax=Oncorhynchus tshawytscha TaxID=74940 RepID=A0AAZ3QDP7_ONCTS
MNMYQSDGKRKVWREKIHAHDPKHTTSSVKHGGGDVMAWACMAASGIGFIDNVTADRIRTMNSEVYRNILSAQIKPNASKLIGRHFIMQQDNDPKHTARATKGFFMEKKWKILDWPSQSPDLNHIEHAEEETEGNKSPKQAGTEDGCSTGLAEHHQGRYPASGDVDASQTSSSHCMQRICEEILTMITLFYIMLNCPMFLIPENGVDYVQKLLNGSSDMYENTLKLKLTVCTSPSLSLYPFKLKVLEYRTKITNKKMSLSNELWCSLYICEKGHRSGCLFNIVKTH